MAVANTEPVLKECELKQCLPQIYKALLTASCLSCPNEPIEFLKNALSAFQGNDNVQDVDWKWKRFTAKSKRDTTELALKMDMTKKHFETKCQQSALNKWFNWVKLRKKTQIVALQIIERLVYTNRHKRIIAAWHNIAKDSKRTKEYFKIFQYLELRDWLNCAEVCCTWKAIIQSGILWSQINLSVEKHWITDSTVKQILQNYRLFVIHLNLRGCTSLTWTSLKFIGECRNLQELNVSECFNVTDMMVQRIVEGCPCLLYLNLSCTIVTNKTLRELSRNCLNLQYLSLAYCYRFTDKGFLYLTTGKGCHNLIHLNLSGCTQMTVNGFKYISTGCPLLKELVIDDMPTLSDSCVLTLLSRCHDLSAISLLDARHLSDIAFKAIAEVSRLQTFSTEGNNQLSDVSWKVLCSRSQGLGRLHAADCPRVTDTTLTLVSTLKNLQYLDISLCNKVSDVGIKYLTEGSSVTKLLELNISHCNITDISVMRIAQRMCKMRRLNLSHCKRLTDMSLDWLSGSSISSLDISGCNIQDQGLAALEGIRLKKLILAECINITDIGIEVLIYQEFPNITRSDVVVDGLSTSTQFPSKTVLRKPHIFFTYRPQIDVNKAFFKLCKTVRDLEHVDVSHCVALSDSAIRAISFYCTGLVTLWMPGCLKITDMAVQYLTSGSRYLQELDVSGCVLLTDRTLQLLERICPPLRSISMACCSNISKVAALKLQPRVKHWEHSSDYPPYCSGYNVGQINDPITRPFMTDDRWDVVEQRSVITRTACTHKT
ncbi:dynein regulatory complex subunit 6 [Echeneis naucrates]|uniref:dynein regulatory complex subunit 6 n=1 Tax=Echeneis naucrates TaxID=173247 RepID=UPI00111387B4|nr:dynein regulatory complex subunit 6 [Echeneis naucrates]